MHGLSGYTCLYCTRSRASGKPFHVWLFDIICEPNIFACLKHQTPEYLIIIFVSQYDEVWIEPNIETLVQAAEQESYEITKQYVAWLRNPKLSSEGTGTESHRIFGILSSRSYTSDIHIMYKHL